MNRFSWSSEKASVTGVVTAKVFYSVFGYLPTKKRVLVDIPFRQAPIDRTTRAFQGHPPKKTVEQNSLKCPFQRPQIALWP